MSFETDFDSAFTILLGKAQGTIVQTNPSTPTDTTTPVATVTNYTLLFSWGGGGQVVTTAAADPILLEIPNAGTVVWARMFAGSSNANPASVTATVTLNTTSYDSFSSGSSLGSVSASGSSKGSADVSGWAHLDDGTAVVGRLTSFSGSATWIAVLVRVRRDA